MTHGRIAGDPNIMMWRLCVKGARITVELILRKLGAGLSLTPALN